MRTLVPALAACLAPLAATAQADEARARYEQAAALYRAGVYDRAAALFEQSFAARESWVTALNLAQALEGAGRPADALRWYDRLLASDADPQRRAAAEAGRAHVRAHGYVVVRCAPIDAEVTVGEAGGRCPDWRGYRPAGAATVTVRAPDRPPLERAVSVPAGDRLEVTVEAPAAVAPVEGGPAWRPLVGWTAVGLGAAGLGLGTWGYLAARDDADAATGGPSPDAKARDEALRADFEDHRALAYAGLGAGLALAAAGAALLFWPDGPVAVAPTGAGVALGGAF